MCELLGMSANVPTDICFSFTGLIRRGGGTGPHRDGWGITFYEGKGSRTFRDSSPGVSSPLAKLVQSYPIKSRIVISHIRRASRGVVSLENTHPFSRELWGQNWTFAHNGTLKGIKKVPVGEFYQPIGSTDSEYAFCSILNAIRHKFPKKPRSIEEALPLIKTLFAKFSKYGTFNVLLSDGEYLYVHCSTNLSWIIRKAPFGRARLIDTDLKVDFKNETSPKDVVAVVATHPLTQNEKWIRMAQDQFLVFKNGFPI